MKKGFCKISFIVLVIGLLAAGCACPEKTMKQELGPTVSVYPGVVKLDKKATVTLMGTGFEPGKTINFVMVTEDGVKTDIGYSFKPEPVPNDTGAWASVWTDLGRFIGSKLVKAGVYTVIVTDSEYNPLAHAPIAFMEEKKEKKKK
jgi:hypothetical protein